jgi:hypothetical protein
MISLFICPGCGADILHSDFICQKCAAEAAEVLAVKKANRDYCWLDTESGRYVLQGKELHCGDCFQVCIDEMWYDVRIEMAMRKWVVIGVPAGRSSEPDAYPARLYPREAK